MRERDKEGGYALIMVAILLFVFLGFAALSVDVGVASSARTQAQRAADAAALAGAFTFINNPAPDPATQKANAEAHAIATATQNRIMGAPIAAGDVTANANTTNRTVTVVVAHTQNTFFGSAVGQETATVSATGIAEAALSATGEASLTPFFIPNTALFDPPGGGTHNQCEACAANPKQVLVEKVNGVNQVTQWALTQIANGINGSTSNRFSLKPKDPHQALRPGVFFLVDVPGTTPGDLDSLICRNTSNPGFCTTTYSILTGDHVGPTNSGIRCRLGCPDQLDTYVAPGQYQRPNLTIVDTSKQLVSVPIWDVCSATVDGAPFCPTGDFPGGTSFQLTTVGFALIFVEGFQSGGSPPNCVGGNAVARVINIAACGGGGGTIDPNETGPFSVPLRLVRMP